MDATDQMIKLSIDGTVLVLKGSKEVLAFLVAACKGMYDKQTQKIAKEIVLSSREPKLWTLSEKDVQIFKKECNRYGINFIALKDNNKDNLYTVVARIEDALIINNIFEKNKITVIESATTEEIINGTKTINEQEQAMELLKERELEKSGTSSAFKEEPQEELASFKNVTSTVEQDNEKIEETASLNNRAERQGNSENIKEIAKTQVDPEIARRNQSPSVQQSNSLRNNMETEEVKIPTVFTSQTPDELFEKKDSVKEVKRPSIRGHMAKIKEDNKNKPTEKVISKVAESVMERS